MDHAADSPANVRRPPGRAAVLCAIFLGACSFDAAGVAPSRPTRPDAPVREVDASPAGDAPRRPDAPPALDAPASADAAHDGPRAQADAPRMSDAPRPLDAPPMSACRSGETFESFEMLPSGGSLPGWNEEVSGLGRAAIVSTSDLLESPGPGAGSSTSWVRLDGPSTFGGDGAAAVLTPPVDLTGCAGSTFAFAFLVFDLEPMTNDTAQVDGRVQGGEWLPLARLFPSTSFPDTNDTCQVGSQQPGTPC